MAAKRTGRPCKLDPKLTEKIVAQVRIGCPPEQAALVAGVPRATFYAWTARGRKERQRRDRTRARPRAGERRFLDLWDALQKGLAECEVLALETVRQAAKRGTWQAAAWLLERRFPDRYSRVEKREVSGPGGAPIEQRSTVQQKTEHTITDPGRKSRIFQILKEAGAVVEDEAGAGTGTAPEQGGAPPAAAAGSAGA